MPFFVVIRVETESDGGSSRGITADDASFASVDAAVAYLDRRDAVPAQGRVQVADAYVVETSDFNHASEMVRAWIRGGFASDGELPPAFHRVRDRFPTYQPALPPPEIDALNHVHSELCISHQLAAVALDRASGGAHAELQRHSRTIEDLGFGLRVTQARLAGNEPPLSEPGQSGAVRLSYGDAQLQGAESATLMDALQSLGAELSIAASETSVAAQAIEGRGIDLTELIGELDAFRSAVTRMESQAQ